MSLPLPTSGRYPISGAASSQARASRLRSGMRLHRPLISAMALNLVLWGGLITGVRALIS